MKKIDFKNQNFLDWCEENKAEYTKEEKDNCYGVWICSSKETREEDKLAILFSRDGVFKFGIDNCKDFNNEKYMDFHSKEIEWIVSILNILKTWRR